MRRVLAGLLPLLVLSFSLAGCASSEDDPKPNDLVIDGTATSSPTPSASGTPTPSDAPPADPSPSAAPGVNTPPVASLDADLTEAEAPVDIVFTVDASDAEGDALTWTLDADGDGAADSEGTQENLPFDFTYTFDTAGTYEATLTVGDGVEETVATLAVTILEAAGPTVEPVVITGTALAPNPAHPVQCLRGGVDGDLHSIAPAEAGWTWTIEPDTFYVYWWAGDTFVDVGGNAGGEVPEGATDAEICSETAVDATYTMTLTPA